MPVGLRIAINSLSVRRGRTLLIIIAVALSTSMVVAVSSAIESANRSVRAILDDTLGRTDLRIRHQTQGRFDESLVDQVRAWPEVEDAAPRLSSNMPIVNLSAIQRAKAVDPTINEDEMIQDERRIVTTHGVDYSIEWIVHPPPLLEGAVATRESEIVVDPRVANRLDVKVGDRVRIGSFGRENDFTVSGILDRQTLAILQKAEIRMPLDALQNLTGHPGEISMIDIILKDGADPRKVLEQHGGDFQPPIEIVLSDRLQAGLDRQMRGATVLEYVSVVCVFLVAAFIVLTGMTTAVAERIQELAVLRCIGAAKSQVFLSQLWSGGIIGIVGGVIGLPLGVAFAWGLYAVIGDVIREGLHFSLQTISLSLGSAVLAGFAGALLPALGAAQTSPLSALTFAARTPRRRGIIGITLAGIVSLAVCIAVLRLPSNEQVAFWLTISVGLFGLAFGFFVLSAPIVQVLGRLFGRVLSRAAALPPNMLRESIRATPYRHGFSAGALMLGLAAMTSMWSSGQALVNDWIAPIEFPDAFIVNMSGFDPARVDKLREEPFIENTCSISTFKLPVVDRHLFGIEGIAPTNVTAVVFEPRSFFEMTNLEWIQGDKKTAEKRLTDENTILVAREFLAARNIGVGDHLRLGPEGEVYDFEVVGVVSSPGLDIATNLFGIQGEFFEQAINCVFMSRNTASRCFHNEDIHMVQFNLAPGVDDEAAKKKITEIIGPGQFGSGREIKAFLIDSANDLMSVVSFFAMLGMIIAGFGAANVMIANVAARQYEYGVLRATGAPRSVLGRLIVLESVLVALGACISGVSMGMFGAWNTAYFYQILAGLIISPRVPWQPVAIGCAFLIAVGIVAALPPAISIMRKRPIELLRGLAE